MNQEGTILRTVFIEGFTKQFLKHTNQKYIGRQLITAFSVSSRYHT